MINEFEPMAYEVKYDFAFTQNAYLAYPDEIMGDDEMIDDVEVLDSFYSSEQVIEMLQEVARNAVYNTIQYFEDCTEEEIAQNTVDMYLVEVKENE